MSSFNRTNYRYILLKVTPENYEKYCANGRVTVGSYLGFDLFKGIYFHADIVEYSDYLCSSDEEFDQLIFLYHLEN